MSSLTDRCKYALALVYLHSPQLPECLRIVAHLRRVGVFSESEMRLQVQYIFKDFSVHFYCIE